MVEMSQIIHCLKQRFKVEKENDMGFVCTGNGGEEVYMLLIDGELVSIRKGGVDDEEMKEIFDEVVVG
jgi:hypothetical protein